jgi:cellulose biosynthesis protein BcsQ
VRTLEHLFEFVANNGWMDLRMLPFFSMVDRRKTLHKEIIDELRQKYPVILSTEVPYGSDFERIAARRAPVESYAPASAAAEVYRQLWKEIDARLAGTGARVAEPILPLRAV